MIDKQIIWISLYRRRKIHYHLHWRRSTASHASI